jgi:hypothetical protein
MPSTGDTAILRFGSDNKWHWFFLTPSASSMLGFDSSAIATTNLMAGFSTAAQGAKADSALQNAAAFATSSQGSKADSALQSFTETDPVALAALATEATARQTIASNLAAEVGLRSSGDSTNAAAISAESTARASGDTAAKAFSIQRSNHTGTQLLATISDAGTAASHAATDFATSAQGALATTALQSQAGLILSADTGWTANNTVGDKTAALSSYSNGLNSTIIAALNLAAANSGTALGAALDVLVTVVKQLAAIRAVLVAAKLPNV